mgnify:CR=1 FL=1
MTYTEIKENNGKKYFYRVRSIRENGKFKKQRIYLGKNLSKKELAIKAEKADQKLKIPTKLSGLEKLKPRIIEILKKNKIKKAGVFGSYARGEEKKDSDVDIIIQPTRDMGFEFTGLEIELSKKLHKKIDLVSYNGLSPYLKEKILEQELRII